MPEPREENSVLFSLKELQRLEDERVRKEDEERRAQLEAERRAREEAERRTRDEIERKRREEEDRIRRLEDERQNQERDGQLRLQEAERRARVEGEMRLAEERMRLEVQGQKHAKAPMGPIIGIVAVLVVIAGGVFWKIRSDHEAERAAATAEALRLAQESQRREQELERKYSLQKNELEKALSDAKTEEAKARIRDQIQQANEREAARRNSRPTDRRASPTGRPEAPAVPRIRPPKNEKINDDPLDGLKL